MKSPTRRQSQRRDLSRLVLVAVLSISNGAAAHESRQLPSWLIFDVGQRTMADKNPKPWVGFMPGEEYEGVIAANREGLLRFRALLDETLAKKHADVSDLWDDFRELRLVDDIPVEKKEASGVLRVLQICGVVALLMFLLVSLVVGAVQIFRWIP